MKFVIDRNNHLQFGIETLALQLNDKIHLGT